MVSKIYTRDFYRIRIASERRELNFAARDLLQTASLVGRFSSLAGNHLFSA
jgi:hypothetical protein